MGIRYNRMWFDTDHGLRLTNWMIGLLFWKYECKLETGKIGLNLDHCMGNLVLISVLLRIRQV